MAFGYVQPRNLWVANSSLWQTAKESGEFDYHRRRKKAMIAAPAGAGVNAGTLRRERKWQKASSRRSRENGVSKRNY